MSDQSVNPQQVKVLLIDDLQTMRKVMRKLLTQLGFSQFEEAGDGVSGLEKIQNGQFDIVFSDWNMPGLQGIDLLKQVRADQRFKTLPFIMVTANRSRDHVAEAVTNGANDYISKPFDCDVLRAKIENALKKKLEPVTPQQPPA